MSWLNTLSKKLERKNLSEFLRQYLEWAEAEQLAKDIERVKISVDEPLTLP